MYILDTDVLRAIFDHPGQKPNLERRIKTTPYEHLWISTVSVSEILRGALDCIKRNEQSNTPSQGYTFLEKVLVNLLKFQILSFDKRAEEIYVNMSAGTKRLGPKDCQIAASAIATDWTVVTINTQDFERIQPPVQCVDWNIKPR